MKIKWLGHACFLITADNGVRILTDPFDESIGYELPAVKADIVTTSHEHHDHNNIKAVKGNFEHIDQPGSYIKYDIGIRGILTGHDENGGRDRGDNTVFKFVTEGMSVCHCGDLGHVLSDWQVEKIAPVDILLLPVGGTYTLDYIGAATVMKQLKPKITIPMHFKTDALNFPIDGVDKFLKEAGGGEMAGKQELEISKENVDNYSSIIVLNYK